MSNPSNEPHFVTCRCQHCGGGIEFDASDFEKGETRTVECPHCHLETVISVPPLNVPPILIKDCFSEFIGQQRAKDRLKKLIDESQTSQGMIQNLILSAPQGYGKTALAVYTAKGLMERFKIKVRFLSGLQIKNLEQLYIFFSHLEDRDLILLDDIDQMNEGLLFCIKQMMIDFKIYVGESEFNLPHFRIIATLTDKSKLPAVVLICFPEIIEFQAYSQDEMKAIAAHFALKSNLAIDNDALNEISGFCEQPNSAANTIEFIRVYMRARNLGNLITSEILFGALNSIATKNESDYTRQVISSEVKREVWRRDGGKCSKCGSRERLEYDHIIPVSKGGSNTARNIELLCEACNRAKRDSIQ
jgi:Holliday junction resolvasome RuvABC ATP-dependent DNA helicase subunit